MLKPIKNKVIVQLIEKETVTLSGIILSSADPSEANRGVVVAIGDEVTDVQVGEVILPNWNKAVKTKVGMDEFYIVEQEDIVLVFED